MSARLIDSLASTAAIAAVFEDRSLLQAMLDVETALARAEAAAGVIPRPAADAIARAGEATSTPMLPSASKEPLSRMMNPPELYRQSGYDTGVAKRKDEPEMVSFMLNWFDLAMKNEPLECHPIAEKHWREGYEKGLKG